MLTFVAGTTYPHPSYLSLTLHNIYEEARGKKDNYRSIIFHFNVCCRNLSVYYFLNYTLMSEKFSPRKFREWGHSQNFACFDGINSRKIWFSQTKHSKNKLKSPFLYSVKQKMATKIWKLCLVGIKFRNHLISRMEASFAKFVRFSGREIFWH